MKRFIHGFVAMVAMLMLGACAGMPGQFNGLGDDPMSMVIVYNTDGEDGTLTEEQYSDVVKITKKMEKVVRKQLPSSLEAAASSGLAYGAAGMSSGISVLAAISAVSGAVVGVSTASYAFVWVVADATETAMRDAERKGDMRYTSLHVSASFVRSLNSEKSPAPKLVQNRN